MPEGVRCVVVNTTPIISLALIGQLGLLWQLYGDVAVPTAVQSEVSTGGATGIGAPNCSRRAGFA
jgi:predicted nucleic acid-binding protein